MKIHLVLFSMLIVSALRAQSLDPKILEEIKVKAKSTHSDALLIRHNGKIIHEEYSSQKQEPIYIASAGKSLVSLAIGRLLKKKQLDSLDQPVWTLFPEWKQGMKKEITIRMLLNHTSGLQNNPNASVELEPAPTYKVKNVIQLALAAELSSVPGSKVEYNNKAVALLGGIIEKTSGKRMDIFFKDEFFIPLGITKYSWIQDETGNPTAHGAFVLLPRDLLKFGELMLNNGEYNGTKLLDETWIQESWKQSQSFSPIWGLLWWRLPKFERRIIDEEIINSWKAGGVDKSFIKQLQPLQGITFENKFTFFAALANSLGENWNEVLNEKLQGKLQSSKRIYSSEIIAYYADGYRGNYLVIIPQKNIIAVRCADNEGFNYGTDSFDEFVELVAKL